MEISNLGIEDPNFFHQWSISSFDELSAFGDVIFESFQETKQQNQQLEFNNKRSSCEELTEINVDERALKQMRSDSFSSCEHDHQLASTNHHHQLPTSNNYFNNNSITQVQGIAMPKQEISFPTDHPHVISQQGGSFGDYHQNNNYVFKISQGANKRVSNQTASRLPHAQDHILAERRRREKLSQRFIALSALVPGLKKMDKASVLGEAIKYLKQLQEKVKALEEQARKKSTESVVFVKRHEMYADDNNSSSDDNSSPSAQFQDSLPQIEARFSDKDVLIRVHCEKKKGVLAKVVSEVEKLHLSVVNTNSMTFCSALDITVIARMKEDFSMTVKDFMKNLSLTLKTVI
ncbi:basic helix-loop-helix transcription factor [Lithospermum erythrorhizon]|uniref:Basic helix-loop-helix transcription factor n=1 Tax=Lithospermum erythrorhizon TaxID=34254 RepID=A0AAV3P1F1_LITER